MAELLLFHICSTTLLVIIDVLIFFGNTLHFVRITNFFTFTLPLIHPFFGQVENLVITETTETTNITGNAVKQITVFPLISAPGSY